MAEKAAAIPKAPKSRFKQLEEVAQKNHMKIKCDFKQENSEFVATIIFGDEEYTGSGSSKKTAKDNAANDGLMNTKYNEIKTEKTQVTKLNELCQKDRNVRSDKDEQNIIELISDNLNFEYSVIVDPTKAELLEKLQSIANMLNEQYTSYYCFIMFIMGHGSQFGIRTADKEGKKVTITVEDILDQFRNDKIPNFVGKPKMIFSQSCRGGSFQETFVQPDGNDDDTVEKISAPTDADILIAYSTTEGYKSFRQKNAGSIFIYECMKKFKESYANTHIEEMMIDVKAAVASGSIGKAHKRVQMPCTWSTLTKRFYFRCTEPRQS
ncbi:caspase-3-like [Mytilus galloprovincialis]|uniref:caspase-3-like n=1 Tax=Mytilus galloprovincialis TaxID=29158 RepID=UPI003F7C3E6A